MYTELNLAKAPFRNRSLFWLGTTAAFLVAFVALALVLARAGAVGADTQTLELEIQKEREAIAALEARIEEAKAEKSRAVFSPQDVEALDDARTLITMKSFSWTRLFNDIEPHLPARSRLTAIQIGAVTGEGSARVVNMTMQGIGQDFGQMGAFIANLDRSGGRFTAEPVSNGQAGPSGEHQFVIRVTYRPGVAAPAAAPAEEAGNG